MTQKDPAKIRWAPRLRPLLLRQLYESDARGFRDMELCDEVGTTLFARCRTFVLVHQSQVECPVCRTVFAVPQRYYAWTERTPEAVQAFVQMFLDQQQEQPRCKFQLAVTLKPDGQLIGNCGIRLASADAQQGDIGYELSPRHWGQGYATEAVRAIVRFGFAELGLHRIWAQCVADNAGSARVLEKLGMRLEGRLREDEYYKGRWWDTLRFAILDREWREQLPQETVP